MNRAASFSAFPPRQQAIAARCFHPSKSFTEFREEDVEQSIPARFEHIVRKYPDRLALKVYDQELTYAELNAIANRAANTLVAAHGSKAELVALLLETGAPQFAAVLGVLKAGKFLLLLDPSLPPARIAAMLKDSRAKRIVTGRCHVALAREVMSDGCQLLAWDEIDGASSTADFGLEIAAKALAFVNYTSGSTGEPKGLLQSHRVILHNIMLRTRLSHVCAEDRISLLSSGTANAITNTFFALLNGAALLAFDVKKEGVTKLGRWILEERITICPLGSPLFRSLCETLTGRNNFPDLRIVRLRSEAVFKADADLYKKHFSPNCIFVTGLSSNETGPLRDYLIDHETEVSGSEVPVGYAVPGKQILLVDDAGKEIGFNDVGEIAVRSSYISPGYLRRPELTRAKFKPAVNGGRKRLYLTGDLGLMLPDGCLVYKGRKDFRVKVRGYGVDIAEVETALRAHPGVSAAVVVPRRNQSGEAHLVAYLTSSRPAPSVSELRSFLAERLADYMIPSAFVVLDQMPLTPHNKIDRKALPDPDHCRPELDTPFIAPRTVLEQELAKIWAELLCLDSVGIHDNFFDLGGHSLLASRVLARMQEVFRVDLSLSNFFEAPTVAVLADSIEKLRASRNAARASPLLPATRDGVLPLSFAQQRLWFLDQLEPRSCAYNLVSAYQLAGRLDTQALERSFNEIIRRHQILRTVFQAVDGEPRQIVLSSPTLDVPVVDLRHIASVAERGSELRRLCVAEAQRPFDLTRGPLLRVTLLQVADDEFVLLLARHHIVFDGWSTGVLFRELSILYEAFCKGKPSPLPELPIQYADFALWQREQLTCKVLDPQLTYWKKQLDDLPTLQLPTDRARPAVQSARGAWQHFVLTKTLTQSLKTLSQREGVTLFMTLLTAFQILLHRYTGQIDIATGSPIAGRNRPEIEGLIGFFLNMLVLRTDLSGNPTFGELLARVRKVCLAAYEHQDIPFEKLVEELHPERNLNHNPLFQVTFGLQNTPRFPLEFAGQSAKDLAIDPGIARFDLHLSMEEKERGLRGYFTYNTDLFNRDTISRMIRHFQVLLEGIVANPDESIGSLPLLTEAERCQLLVQWNDTRKDYPRDRCIHELFEKQVERTPDAVGVVFENQQLTYRELNQRANQLARHLKKLGVRPDTLVGVCMERSPKMIVAWLAIAKAGGAFVPLDPIYPEKRLAFMLQDGPIMMLVTESSMLSHLPKTAAHVIDVDTDWKDISQESAQNPQCETTSENLAYVIYTSGSTGQPKGVAVPHRAVNHLVMHAEYVELEPTDVVAQVSNCSFDASTFEIWGALLHGARLILIPTDIVLWPQAFAASLEQHGVTALFLTTALFNQLAAEIPGAFKNVRHLLFGGEAANPQWVAEVLRHDPPRRLLHVYGPTETTTFASWFRVKNVDPGARTIPIGRPIANTQIYLFDKYLQPVPVGVTGELYIGGDGLARGYLNQPELTAERFVPDPFSDETTARLYKTGDWARYLPDGNIEFLGRIDDQVKIRGFRIEPGEIEAALRQHPALREAVVLTREKEPGDKRLVSYVVASHKPAPTANDLRSFLEQKLPAYMLPSAFVFLDSLPLTPNGKLDHRALPVPPLSRGDSGTPFIAAGTSTERALSALWCEVLGLERVCVRDNFFYLGGHSLLAIKLISQLREKFRVDLPLRRLFESPTVAGLAKRIEAEEESKRASPQRSRERWSYLLELQPGTSKRPVFFLPGGIGGDHEFLVYARLVHHVGSEYPFYGLRARSADGTKPVHSRLEEMAADYLNELRSLQPEGPYFLIGECIGGAIAYEMARQLEAQGQRIALLALMDTHRPSLLKYLRHRSRSVVEGWQQNYYGARIAFHFAKIRELGWYDKLPYLLTRVGAAMTDATHILDPARPPVPNADAKATREAHEVQRGYVDTLRRYRPRPYQGRVTVLVNEESYRRDPSLGWSKLALGGLDIHKLPGNHWTYIRAHVLAAASELRKCLERAQAE